jgi:hypothetical protein
MIIQANSVCIPLRSGSVQTAVFSPPYYGLREYATGSWVGGDPGCDHKSGRLPSGVASSGLQGGKSTTNHQKEAAFKGVCGKCGAVRVDHQIGLEATPDEYVQSLVAVMREVWSIPTQPYKGAHFATFPEALVEPCILAGTSAAGACPTCGAPWRRIVKRETNYQARKAAGKDNSDWQTNGQRGTATPRGHPAGDFHDLGTLSLETVGWKPTCKCPPAPPVPCVVLDPFSGTGTVGVVAGRHRRAYVGLELSWAYIKLQRRRLADIQARLLDL